MVFVSSILFNLVLFNIRNKIRRVLRYKLEVAGSIPDVIGIFH